MRHSTKKLCALLLIATSCKNHGLSQMRIGASTPRGDSYDLLAADMRNFFAKYDASKMQYPNEALMVRVYQQFSESDLRELIASKEMGSFAVKVNEFLRNADAGIAISMQKQSTTPKASLGLAEESTTSPNNQNNLGTILGAGFAGAVGAFLLFFGAPALANALWPVKVATTGATPKQGTPPSPPLPAKETWTFTKSAEVDGTRFAEFMGSIQDLAESDAFVNSSKIWQLEATGSLGNRETVFACMTDKGSVSLFEFEPSGPGSLKLKEQLQQALQTDTHLTDGGESYAELTAGTPPPHTPSPNPPPGSPSRDMPTGPRTTASDPGRGGPHTPAPESVVAPRSLIGIQISARPSGATPTTATISGFLNGAGVGRQIDVTFSRADGTTYTGIGIVDITKGTITNLSEIGKPDSFIPINNFGLPPEDLATLQNEFANSGALKLMRAQEAVTQAQISSDALKQARLGAPKPTSEAVVVAAIRAPGPKPAPSTQHPVPGAHDPRAAEKGRGGALVVAMEAAAVRQTGSELPLASEATPTTLDLAALNNLGMRLVTLQGVIPQPVKLPDTH